ncbi:KAP family NTPase [Pseudomonas cichorii]|uniref:KAP family P-loop NTPase fold protein n=1 Tax=Pseudomonas cichorii TaxID=36746 RepID=UPI0021A988C7|nr:KAP family NTPase [Pseudomonas cichorii]
MNPDVHAAKIDFDLPLQPDTALAKDQLSREGFANIAASALRRVSSSAGFVLSIEGAWGSGKSSTLAMIQALLVRDAEARPVIVHFNPWLIGDKDALLRQFLSSIAKAIKLSDHSRDGKKVAKELKAYSKVFDLVKLIPGAEPWTSMIKSVVDATGDATSAISEYKTPDIEAYKQNVEAALRAFDRPVIVFIDDIDRLFPSEVFEMIRIIKAVGELPQIGYVVAWDSDYVSRALQNLNVPHAGSYLDKIVQVRMPLPNLSLSARGRLFNDALESLAPEVLRGNFEGQDKRLGFIYHSGLRELLNQPRDVVRVFNAVRLMEPLLRGEIVFADILGLVALSIKAPAVFELLKRQPRLFVGRLSSDAFEMGDSKNLIEDGMAERKRAYDTCSEAALIKVVHFLFPDVALAEKSRSLGKGTYAEGVISHPSRLAIALQLSLTDGDVSIKSARQYLQDATTRATIVTQLTIDNCDEFVDMLGEVAVSMPREAIDNPVSTCISIARLADAPVFVSRTQSRRVIFSVGIEDLALQKISLLADPGQPKSFASVIEEIVRDPQALTCAAEILRRSYLDSRNQFADFFKLSTARKKAIVAAFASNVTDAGRRAELLDQNRPGFILWTLARLAPEACPNLLRILKNSEPSLDRFALEFLSNSWDSSHGQAYGLPAEEAVTLAFCPLDEFKTHAGERLLDPDVEYPVRAAWQSVIDGNVLYGVDGSEVRR